MEETNKSPHKFSLTIDYELYLKLKREYSFKGQPVVSFGVIGKLIQIYERRLKDVEINLKER